MLARKYAVSRLKVYQIIVQDGFNLAKRLDVCCNDIALRQFLVMQRKVWLIQLKSCEAKGSFSFFSSFLFC